MLRRCRFHVIDHQGVRIGLIGLVEYEWLATMPLLEIDDVLYLDFVAEGRKLSRLLREDHGADMVIALTHMRAPNDLHLGAQVPGIDLILGGHDHHYSIERCHPNKTLLFKSGTDFRELSLIHMSKIESSWVVCCDVSLFLQEGCHVKCLHGFRVLAFGYLQWAKAITLSSQSHSNAAGQQIRPLVLYAAARMVSMRDGRMSSRFLCLHFSPPTKQLERLYGWPTCMHKARFRSLVAYLRVSLSRA